MTKQTILIVEDEILIGQALKIELGRAGYRICGLVASGTEAIEAVRREQPEVVLLDLRLMGAMDGIETARQIGLFSSAKIIFTTGYQDSALKERALTLNPIAYIRKPVDWHEVDAILCSL